MINRAQRVQLLTRTIQCAIAVVLLIALPACKKRKAFKNETAQSAVEIRQAMGEMDEVIKDINTVIMEQFTLRGRVSSQTATTTVCGVVLDTLGQLTGKMTLTYDGSDCYGKVRKGVVVFSIRDYPVRKWKHKDCVLDIEFIQYQVTRTSDNRSIQFDGKQTLQNETGNTWFDIWYLGASKAEYRHQATETHLTFNGSSTAIFSVDRRLSFTHAGGRTDCLVSGAGSHASRSNVEAWGYTTDNENVTAEVKSPYLWHTSCGAVAPVSGLVEVAIEGKEHVLQCHYGVDASAQPVSGQCPFGYEVTWSRKKATNARLFGYY